MPRSSWFCQPQTPKLIARLDPTRPSNQPLLLDTPNPQTLPDQPGGEARAAAGGHQVWVWEGCGWEYHVDWWGAWGIEGPRL